MHQVMPRSQIPPTGGEESARVGAREGTGTTDTDRYARDMARYAHLAIVTRRPTR